MPSDYNFFAGIYADIISLFSSTTENPHKFDFQKYN